MAARAVCAALAAGLLAGCAAGTTSVLTEKDQQEPEDRAGGETAAPEETTAEIVPEAAEDLLAPEEVLPDFGTGGCEPGTGCFLEPCTDNKQCQSGWCLEHMGDGVCTQACVEECPPGWTCKPVPGRDLVYVCVSDHANLCRPCQDSADCKSDAAEDLCVSYGAEGSFCGGACEATQQCPWGFSCKKTETVDGIETMQCVADAGVCPCTAKSVQLGLWTPCAAQNDFGTCAGKRVCESGGLSQCDAQVPAAEVCNGLDDDCDLEVDEPQLVEGKYIELCDDGNACTVDACTGAPGCGYEKLSMGECVDGDACSVADHCEEGECVGLPVVCDDGNPCTDDTCDGQGGCKTEFNSGGCDDGDPCTVADQCSDGVCAGYAVACDCTGDEDCEALDDGNPCTGELYCDTAALPFQCKLVPGSVVACPKPGGPDSACLAAECVPETGKCIEVAANEGMACNDGEPCTLADSCVSGACVGSVPPNCNDGNPCTDDSCVAGSGCQSVPNSVACNDGDACTTGDTCQAGGCAGTGKLACNDGNPCTDDACDPLEGCVFSPNAAGCDDGNACTTGDVCKAGQCTFAAPVKCDDGNVCTSDTCDPAVGCTYALNDAPCDDKDLCTIGDHCALGQCIGSGQLACNDGNACTDDGCKPGGGCTHTPNSAACDDGNACTTGDTCSKGWCTGTGALACNDQNACTDDACNPLKGCVHTPNAAACDDGNACTAGDACLLGQCAGGIQVSCADGNPCTDDTCVPAKGCDFPANTAPCDDGNACSVGDSCANGACVPGKQPLPCDDGNPCTKDACVVPTGCAYSPELDGTDCGAGKTCKNGQCVSGTLASCLAWKQAAPASLDGTYTVDPDGNGGDAPFQVYCDMTTDGGGWALVFRDNIDGAMQPSNTGAQGDVATLATLSGPTAKFPDLRINKMKSANDSRIGYRCSSPSVAHRYFFPASCTYVHSSDSASECMRYSYTFDPSNSPSYIQCTYWGGNGGGLDAWYGCNGNGGYTNVVKTHSDMGRGMAGIVDNYLGNPMGAAGGTMQSGTPPGCGYGNKVLMWVR